MVRTPDPEKRNKILAAALRLFVAGGVANTSTAEIAREAQIAAGTLFLYFPTRQDLLDELILKIGREVSEQILRQLDAGQSARESFLTIWRSTLAWFSANPDAYQYVQQVRDTGLISSAAVAQSNEFFLYYYQAIQKGLEEGSIKPYPPGLTGEFLYQDIAAVMNHIRREPDPARHADLIAQGFEIFWNGIRV